MIASLDAQISAFNGQVIQRQEEAYTLAYYLLGSTETAAKAVQTAVMQVFKKSSPNRLRLLQAVISSSQAYKPAAPDSLVDPLAGKLLSIPSQERRAVLLVDVLGLSYAEAAQVLGTSTGRVSQWLSRGRVLSLAS